MKIGRLSEGVDETSRLLKQVEAQLKASKQAIVLFDTYMHVFCYCSGRHNYHFFDLQACWSDRFDSVVRVLFGFLLPLQLYARLIKEWEMTGASRPLFSC